MTGFTPQATDYADRVRSTFDLQPFMAALGARLGDVAPGAVDIHLDMRPDLCQQNGFLHAGVSTSIADSAAGFAAFSLFKPDTDVLTTEFKVNLLRPAAGEHFVARGRVLKPGRTLTVCRSDVFAVAGEKETHVLAALLSMMTMPGPDA